MRKVKLFIAMSLDGYIADECGNVDWLHGEDVTDESADSYERFIKTVDTVIMGYTTYHQIVTQLSPNEWPYDGLESYVVTHKDLTCGDNIHFCNMDPLILVNNLQKQNGKDIWICGGASIINLLNNANLIDQYYITVVPTLLGKGIRLFNELNQQHLLHLVSTKQSNGMVELIYEKSK